MSETADAPILKWGDEHGIFVHNKPLEDCTRDDLAIAVKNLVQHYRAKHAADLAKDRL